ncbi:MAG: hypothetical protein Q4E29_08545 [Lachnospiraceae bacterium]|nr:hypothetical protein [Lachnospiraceae bacterium]
MKYKIIKYVKDGNMQDLDVTNMSTEELEEHEKQGEFLCPGEKCNAKLCLVHNSKNGGKTCFLKAVDDKEHHPDCDYKIGNYQERISSIRMDGVFTEKQVNDAVRRISNDYMNPVQPKREKDKNSDNKKKNTGQRKGTGATTVETAAGGRIVYGDEGEDGVHGRMRRRYKVSTSDIGIMTTLCGKAQTVTLNKHREMVIKFKDERLENIEVLLGAVYEQNNPTEFRNLYLVKEYFDQKAKTEEVWVAAGGLVNLLNGKLILELQANGSLRVDNQTVMKLVVEDVKKREENQ